MSVYKDSLMYGMDVIAQDWHPNPLQIAPSQWPLIGVVQARETQDELDYEFENVFPIEGPVPVRFVRFNGIGQEKLPWVDRQRMIDVLDGLLIKGAGGVDVTSGAQPSKLYRKNVFPLLEDVVYYNDQTPEHPLPAYGTCLGHQGFHAVTGGEVVRERAYAQTGTVVADLTEHGRKDKHLVAVTVFQASQGVRGAIENQSFAANYGHNDTVVTMGEGFTNLAGTQRNPLAVTRRGVISTSQAHHEIEDSSNLAKRIHMAQSHHAPGTSYHVEFPIYDTPGSNFFIAGFLGDSAQRAQRKGSRR